MKRTHIWMYGIISCRENSENDSDAFDTFFELLDEYLFSVDLQPLPIWDSMDRGSIPLADTITRLRHFAINFKRKCASENRYHLR